MKRATILLSGILLLGILLVGCTAKTSNDGVWYNGQWMTRDDYIEAKSQEETDTLQPASEDITVNAPPADISEADLSYTPPDETQVAAETLYQNELVNIAAPISQEHDDVKVYVPLILESGDNVLLRVEVMEEPYHELSCGISAEPPIVLVGQGILYGFSKDKTIIEFTFTAPTDGTYNLVLQNAIEEDVGHEHSVKVSAIRMPTIQ